MHARDRDVSHGNNAIGTKGDNRLQDSQEAMIYPSAAAHGLSMAACRLTLRRVPMSVTGGILVPWL